MRQRKRMKKYFIFKKYEWRNNGHFLSKAQKVAHLYISKNDIKISSSKA